MHPIESLLAGQRGRFIGQLGETAEVQRAQCLGIARSMEQTAFGRQWGLAQVHSLADFRAAVPLMHWEDLEPWVQRELAGEALALLPEPPLAAELTGGSTRGPKAIPYPASQLAAF